MTWMSAGSRGGRFVLCVLAAFLVAGGLQAAPQSAASQTAEPDRSAAYYHYSLAHLFRQLAVEHVRQEYIKRALEEYKKAIEADPDSSYIRMELAELYARTNRLDDAAAEVGKILKREPKDIEALRLLGAIYRNYATDQRGRINKEVLDKAIQQYEKILEIDSSEQDSLLQLSRLYQAAQERDKAEEVLKRLLKVEPDSAEALSTLANLYLSSGDTDGAIEALERVVNFGEATRMQLETLARAYERASRYEEAAKVFEQLVERGGDTLAARKGLAQSLVLSGQFDKAQEQYEILVQADPSDVDNYIRLSQIHREQRHFKQAWAQLERGAEIAPESLEIDYNRVLLFEREGQTAEAIQTMEQLLAKTEKEQYTAREKQNRALFYEQLGFLHRSDHNTERAVEAFRQMGELDSRAEVRAWAHQIDTYRGARDFDRARQTSREAVEKLPDSRGLLIQRATLLAETGNVSQGEKILKKLLTGERQDREILLALAQVYEKGKLYDKAVAAIQKAEKLSPTKGEKLSVLFTHGSVLERAKRFDQAEAKFRELLAIDPDHSSALNYLGYMLADLDKSLDEAHDMVQKALDAEPENGAYLDSLGWVYYRQGKFELAERYLRRSLEKVKDDPIVHSHLGDVYRELGRLDQARKHWEQSLQEWERSAPADRDPAEIAKVRQKLSQLGPRLSSTQTQRDN